MFTGIVKETGRVDKLARGNSSIKLGIKSGVLFEGANPSDSICVNGACLTLTHKEGGVLFFEAVASTLDNTNLKRLKKGESVNLEPALNLGDKLGGHFVLGHVDAELKLIRAVKKSGHWQLEINLPAAFRKSIVENGSIAVDGISLTVKKILPQSFSVHVIPFTYDHTNLRFKRPGSFLNIEFDYLLKKNKL